MVERLNEYLAKLESEKVDIENADVEEVIKQMVSDYEASVRADFANKRAKSLADKEIEINVFKRFIEVETLKAAEEARFRAEQELAAISTSDIGYQADLDIAAETIDV